MTRRATPDAVLLRQRAKLGALIVAIGLLGCVPGPAESPSSSEPTPAASRPMGTRWWVPKQGATWHIQYSGDLAIPDDAEVVNLDSAESSAQTVQALNATGRHAICYLNAGAVEDWRADADQFPDDVVGKPMQGWPGEQWLDIRRLDVLLPIMAARMDECASKGFVGVDPDNVHGFETDTGFALTSDDAVQYVTELARLAHDRGLAIGLKNGLPIIDQTVDVVDFAVNEECVAYDECAAYQPFLDAGKAVFHIEYEGDLASVCPARPDRFSTLITNVQLDGQSTRCE